MAKIARMLTSSPFLRQLLLVVLLFGAMGSAMAQAPKAVPDYQRAVYDPIHFKPAIDKATNEQCLACHAEVLKPSVRKNSIAGVSSEKSKAWYQDTSTYKGDQDTFHRRHLTTQFATQVMTMKCTTCHEGMSPRDEAPNTSASDQGLALTLRKLVNPETSCLKCHGTMNHEVMGLPDTWQKIKATFQNNCMLCHAGIRTKRHHVDYLKPDEIEKLGSMDSEVCFGCHGGRAWYRIPFPYARNAWPGMPTETPDWAKNRPTTSDVRFLSNVLQKEQAR